MGNFTLGRLLSIFLPGFALIFIVAQLFYSVLIKIPSLDNELFKNVQALIGIITVASIVIGLIIDQLRIVWVNSNKFKDYFNFYKPVKYWWRPLYLFRKKKESFFEEQPYSVYFEKYEKAYREAYNLWLKKALKNNSETIDIAKESNYNEVLYAIGLLEKEKSTRKNGKSFEPISITYGQIWPILAIKQKEAFKFHQEYFQFDISANLMITMLIGVVISIIIYVINIGHAYIGLEIYTKEYKHLFDTHDAFQIFIYFMLYVAFASISSRLNLAQMRFFRFLLIYDALEIGSSKKETNFKS
jgi:hypothetical protein